MGFVATQGLIKLNNSKDREIITGLILKYTLKQKLILTKIFFLEAHFGLKINSFPWYLLHMFNLVQKLYYFFKYIILNGCLSSRFP